MRPHSWIAPAAGVLALACSNAETVPPPPAAPVSWRAAYRVPADAGPVRATDKERAAAGGYERALASPGFAGLRAVLDEDAHFAFGGMKDAHGRDNVIAAHQKLLGAFDQRTFTARRVWITESSQALEWTMTGVQARDWEGVAATHGPVVIQGITLLWTNDDGSVTDVQANFDEARVKVQLGAGPKELAALPPPQVATAPVQEFEQERSGEESTNVAQVRASLSALERGDEAAYLATMTDDVEVTTPERAQAARGKDEARTYFKAIRKQIAELDTSVDNAWGVGRFVIIQYFVVGTQTAPLGWIPLAHDRLLKLSVVDVVEMRAGSIARVWRYEDPGQVLAGP
jgi:ketosteroid isomerase-like protein